MRRSFIQMLITPSTMTQALVITRKRQKMPGSGPLPGSKNMYEMPEQTHATFLNLLRIRIKLTNKEELQNDNTSKTSLASFAQESHVGRCLWWTRRILRDQCLLVPFGDDHCLYSGWRAGPAHLLTVVDYDSKRIIY